MFNGDLKNPVNVYNMMTGEKVSSQVINDGVKKIRSEKHNLNIH